MTFPLQAVPFVRLAKRLFLGRGDLEAVSERQELLCREEYGTNRPAIFLPGQLERITGAPPESTIGIEIATATARFVAHAPTIAYHVRNATLLGGSVYVGRYRHLITRKKSYASGWQEPLHFRNAALASSYCGVRYFCHWLRDDCAQFLLAKQFGQPLCMPLSYSHKAQYEGYFEQDWAPIERAQIDHLVIFQDFSQNSLKKKRYDLLRRRIKEHFPGTGQEVFVYLRRGRSGVPRLIQNEAEIQDELVKRGFVIVDIEADSLEHILRTLSDAKVVVSIEGSHIDHCWFACPEGSGLVDLQPAHRFAANHCGLCECLNMRYGFVVGPAGEGGYYFSVSEILRTIDLMLRAMAAENSARRMSIAEAKPALAKAV
jgi:hypothetical protein